MRLPVLFAAMLLNLTAYAGSDPPPAGALPSCPQASSSIEVSTSPDVAGMNVGTNQVLSGAELDALSELGVGWSRITVRWSDVQRTSTGTPDWAGLDANVKALKSRGINVLATVNSTPKWAFAAGAFGPDCAGRKIRMRAGGVQSRGLRARRPEARGCQARELPRPGRR